MVDFFEGESNEEFDDFDWNIINKFSIVYIWTKIINMNKIKI
jgi:hypothetical protein